MMKYLPISFIALAFLLLSCSDDDAVQPVQDTVTAPANYTFERDGSSTIAFTGQSTRIAMAEELISGMLDFNKSELELLEMYRNESENGGDVSPFDSPDLNSATVSIRSKIAASFDLYSANASESSIIKADFENWIGAQVSEVYPNNGAVASPGNPGQIADGSSTRYVNSQGLEYNQMVAKSLNGALMADQILNNYLSPAVLDAADNRTNNTDKVLSGTNNYTTMEHFWDEAYGYIYGASADPKNPNLTIGDDDSFLNKYIGSVNSDEDFSTIADDIFNAFKLGRAAIVANNYEVRDQQIAIIRAKISEVIAIRAVYYLEQAKNTLPSDRNNFNAYGPALHDLSEAYGFIYSLRFCRNANERLFTTSESEALLDKMLNDGTNGLWDIELSTLDEMSNTISSKFNFTIAQAGA